MATITDKNVGDIVEDMSRFYKPKNEACGNSTPAQMRLLIERLSDYTDQVKAAADEHGVRLEYYDIISGTKKKIDTPINAQFALDMANWDTRLSHYRRAVEQIPDAQANTPAGCESIYKQVTAPLIDGIYYEILPGTNLNTAEKQRILSQTGHPQLDVPTTVGGKDHPPGHSNAKPPDLVTPFSLGNQVLVWHEHQEERNRLFWSDLKENAQNLGSTITDAVQDIADVVEDIAAPIGRNFLMPLGFALLGTAAVAVTGFAIYSRFQSNKIKRDIERASNPRALRTRQ